MLREQNDRRAARRDLHRAGNDATREDLAIAGGDLRTAQACAHAVAGGFDPKFGFEEQRMRLIRETLRVRTRDGAYLSGVVIRTERETARPLHIQAGPA